MTISETYPSTVPQMMLMYRLKSIDLTFAFDPSFLSQLIHCREKQFGGEEYSKKCSKYCLKLQFFVIIDVNLKESHSENLMRLALPYLEMESCQKWESLSLNAFRKLFYNLNL